MVPDNIAEELAVIYGEQPPQAPAPIEPEPTAESEPEPTAESEPEPPDTEAPAMRLLGGIAYRVQPGDTPASIAVAHYGDAAYAETLLAFNQALGILINDNLTINADILLP